MNNQSSTTSKGESSTSQIIRFLKEIIFNPYRFPSKLIWLGVALVSVRWWEPFLYDAYGKWIAKKDFISIGEQVGILLIGVGFSLFFYYRYRDYKNTLLQFANKIVVLDGRLEKTHWEFLHKRKAWIEAFRNCMKQCGHTTLGLRRCLRENLVKQVEKWPL